MPDITSAHAASILTYGTSRSGTVVQPGQCYDLANLALTSAGAKSAPNYGTITPTANYVWGRALPSLSDAAPADIVQFRGYSATVRTRIDISEENGDTSFTDNTQTNTRPHHTAIVQSIGTNGRMTVMEQNVPLGGGVTSVTLYFQSSTSATTTTVGTATHVTTVTVTVTGTLWYYRPEIA